MTKEIIYILLRIFAESYLIELSSLGNLFYLKFIFTSITTCTYIASMFTDILDRVVSGSQKAEQVKKAIWKFELLQSVLIALKQDFSQIQGKWKTAASLSKILA